MTEQEIKARLHAETEGVRVSQPLRQRTLDAVRTAQKEDKPMKRKLSVALIAAMIGVLLCAAALAAVAYRAGMLDFIGQLGDKKNAIPDDALNYVQTDVYRTQEQGFTVSIREAYYDGSTLRFTMDVAADDPQTLLLGFDCLPDDTLWNLTRKNEDLDSGRRVIDLWREGGYRLAYSVEAGPVSSDDALGGSGDYVRNDDGTLTIYQEYHYASRQPTRTFELFAWLIPYNDPEQGEYSLNHQGMLKIGCPLTITAAVREDAQTAVAYANVAPIDFPQSGVRIDTLLLEPTPLDIRYTIRYTVTDRDAFARMGYGLWFEFIDPESAQAEPYMQRLQEGLQGGEVALPLDGDFDTAVHYRQDGSLGLSEFHDSYTLRAYECLEDQRLDTCAVDVRPLTVEEWQAMQAQIMTP